MFKIERFLIRHGFRKAKQYTTSVGNLALIYKEWDEDGFYGDDVTLLPMHEPPCWEVHVNFGECICISGKPGAQFDERQLEYAKVELERRVKANVKLNDMLRDLDDPWKEVAD